TSTSTVSISETILNWISRRFANFVPSSMNYRMAHQNNLDLLLVNPGSRTQVYQALANTLAAIEPPVWAGLMAAFARNRGLSVAILDAEAEGLTAEQPAASRKSSHCS